MNGDKLDISDDQTTFPKSALQYNDQFCKLKEEKKH